MNDLRGVSAVSATDAWAVGDYVNDNTGADDTFILHWNGTKWSKVASPNPSPSYNYLFGVSAESATDVWAVGQDFTSTYDTLILHWDGTNWSKVNSPSPSMGGNFLSGVSADSGTDAWAVGQDWNHANTGLNPLVLHWDGSSWSKA
jgi:hypothetical protein